LALCNFAGCVPGAGCGHTGGRFGLDVIRRLVPGAGCATRCGRRRARQKRQAIRLKYSRLCSRRGCATRCGRRTYCTWPTAVALHSDSHESAIAPLAAFGSLLGSSPTAPHHRHTDVHVRVSVLATVHGRSCGAVTASFAK
jgi:hypothetical protein